MFHKMEHFDEPLECVYENYREHQACPSEEIARS